MSPEMAAELGVVSISVVAANKYSRQQRCCKYQSHKYKYKYKYLTLKYKYKYKYFKMVLEYYSSTSTNEAQT